jgi:hypothetical protein
MTDQRASENEQFTEPKADRQPTAEEERAAERAAADVDLDEVEEHYEEMTEIGKNVKGEGDLFPTED